MSVFDVLHKHLIIFSTIFKTYESDLDGITNKLGFSKRSFAEWGKQVKESYDTAGKGLKGFLAANKTMFVSPKEDLGWLTYKDNTGDKIRKIRVDRDNIDNYIFNAQDVDPDVLDGYITKLTEVDKGVKVGTDSWQEYSDSLDDNLKWIAQWGQETEGQIRKTDDLVKANQNARQAAIAHNAALEQQTLGAKAAKVAMSALASIGTAIVTTLIMTGISKLMNKGAEEAQRAADAYEFAKEESEKVKEKQDFIFSSTKKLSELLEGEDWGVDQAKEASEIYEAMANRLEETNGANKDRIEQLREEAKLIREGGALNEEERKRIAAEARVKALDDAGWDIASANTASNEVDSTKKALYKAVEEQFSLQDNSLAHSDTADGYSHMHGYVKALPGDLFYINPFTHSVDLKDEDEINKIVFDKMKPWLSGAAVIGGGQEYINLVDSYDIENFIIAMNELQSKYKNLSSSDLYNALKSVGYDPFINKYNDWQSLLLGDKEKLAFARATAHEFVDSNGITGIDSLETEKLIRDAITGAGYSGTIAETVMQELRDLGFYTEDYNKKVHETVTEVGLSPSELESLSEKINLVSSAFKELSDDGYITTKTISGIKEALDLSEDEWANYESKLINAKPNTEESNQLMADLTFKLSDQAIGYKDLNSVSEEYIAAILRENGVLGATEKAHEIVTMAMYKQQVQAELSDGITVENIKNLKKKTLTLGFTKNAMIDLVLSEIRFNKNKLDVDQKVSSLKEVALWAGVAAEKIEAIDSASNSWTAEEKKGWANENNFDILGTDKENQYWEYEGKTYYSWAYRDRTTGEIYDSVEQPKKDVLLERAIQDEIDEINEIKFDTSSSSSSSKSNEPKYSDFWDELLEDRENEVDAIEETIDRANTRLEYALSTGNAEQISIWTRKLEELTNQKKSLLESQADGARNDLAQIMQRIWAIAPELSGKNIDEISSYDIERISQSLSDNEYAQNEWDNLTDVARDYYETINEWSNEWWEELENEVEVSKKVHEDVIDDIEHKKDMALNTDPYADTTLYDKQLQDEYHKRAEYLRSLRYKDDSQEIQELQQKWWDAQKDIEDFDKNRYENALDELDKYVERVTYSYQKEIDTLDKQITKEEALLKIKQGQYDTTNKLKEAQKDIGKEIENSRNSKEYLSKSEYEKIFGEADYEFLSGEIEDITNDIAGISADFYQQIEDAYKNDQLYLVEAITAEYERQLASKERELEIAKAKVDLEKKRLTLENAKNERNIKQYSENGITWVADQEKVKQATEDFIDAQATIKDLQEKSAQQMELDSRQANIDMLNSQKESIEYQNDLMNKATENLKLAIENVTDPLANLGALIQNLINDTNKSISEAAESVNSNFSGSRGSSGGSSGGGGGGGFVQIGLPSNYEGATVDVKGVGKVTANIQNGKTQNPGLKPGDVVNTSDGRHWEITGGTAGNYTSKEVDKPLYDSGGIASGKGLMLKGVDEEETVLPPWLTEKVLTPEYNQNFSKLLENMEMVSQFNTSDFIVKPLTSPMIMRNNNQPTSISKTWTGNMYVEGGDPNEVLKAISDAFDRNMP